MPRESHSYETWLTDDPLEIGSRRMTKMCFVNIAEKTSILQMEEKQD